MNLHKNFTLPGLLLCAAALPAQAQVHARNDRIGDVLQYLVPAGAAGLSLYEHDTEGVKELAYSLALSQGTTEVLKRAFDSKRPDGTGRGFPSGHTSAVFASAAFVHERYGMQMALPYTRWPRSPPTAACTPTITSPRTWWAGPRWASAPRSC